MLMNIGTDYSALVLAIQKNLKVKTTNLREVILQIIRYFEFIEGNEKTCKVMQTSNANLSIHRIPKNSCTKSECVEKGLTTQYTNCY